MINVCKYNVLIPFLYSNLPGYTDAFTAMKFALESQRNQSKNDFKFLLTMAKIDTIDAYKLSRIICTQVNLYNKGETKYSSMKYFEWLDDILYIIIFWFIVPERYICIDGYSRSWVFWHPSLICKCIRNAICYTLVSRVNVQLKSEGTSLRLPNWNHFSLLPINQKLCFGWAQMAFAFEVQLCTPFVVEDDNS